MQKRYSYVIEARPGRDSAAGFTPFYTPKEMLALGVYWLGRRLPKIDARQIKRWRAFARHAAQVRKNCEPGNVFYRHGSFVCPMNES